MSSDLTWYGDNAKRAATSAGVAGLRTALDRYLGQARAKAPYETGALRASGSTTLDCAALTGTVSFSADYAVPVHERVDVQHPIGGAKFLEHALQDPSDLLDELAAALNAALR